MVASIQKNNRMVSRLVAKGADVFLLDVNGRSAMDHVQKGHNQVRTCVTITIYLLLSPC